MKTAQTIDQVIDELTGIVNDSIQNESPLGYFPALYKRVTIAVRDKIHEGYFADGPRMERLDVVFANRYLDAYTRFKDHQPCTSSWELAMKATGQKKYIVLQHLLAGMNAHISLDLGIAAATVASGEAIHSLRDDFYRINKVLSDLIDEVQDELAQIWPMLKLIDGWGKRADEALAGFSMDIARDIAWARAVQLAGALGPERERLIAAMDVKVAGFGHRLLEPGKIMNAIRWFVRLTEGGTVADKIRMLDRVVQHSPVVR